MNDLRVLFTALLLTAGLHSEARAVPPPLPEAPPAQATSKSPPGSAAPAKKKSKKTTGAAYVPPPELPVVAAPRGPSPTVPPVTPITPPPVISKPKTRVTVPRTEHVHAELPSGLQADLDADPRMQPWVEKVIAIADSCHSQARGNTGTLEAQITMHENERPTADLRSLPPQLGSLVACATGSLLRIKMPLFTGREGTRYTVRVVFE